MDKYKKIKQETLEIVDNNNKKIDDKIFNLVFALRLNGFNTVNSCEGHIENSFFSPTISISESEKLNFDDRLKSNVIKLSELITLLNDFYKHQKSTPYRHMLICSASWGNASFIELRPNSGLSSAYEVRNIDNRKKLHNIYINECNQFAEFLIDNYKKKQTK